MAGTSEKQPRLHIAFNWVIYMTGSANSPDEWLMTVEHSTRRMLELFEKHPRVRSNLSIGGWVSRHIQDNHRDVADMIRAGVKRGQYEITNRPYFHAIASMIPYDEAVMQIKKSLDINEEIWGQRPVGAHHAEFPWDPVTGKMLLDLGVQWQLLANYQRYRLSHPAVAEYQDIYRAAKVKTIEGGEITAAFVSFEKGADGIPDDLCPAAFLKTIHGSRPVNRFQADIEQIQRLNRDGDMMALFFGDSEMFWRSPFTGSTGLTREEMEERYEQVMKILEAIPYVEFVTVSEYLRKFPARSSCYIRPSVSLFSPGKGWNTWHEGNYEQALPLNIQCDRATEDIHNAESIVLLADKLGADTARSEVLIAEAYERLMKAKLHAGRGYNTREEITVWCGEHAVAASRLAREAMKAIEVNKR